MAKLNLLLVLLFQLSLGNALAQESASDDPTPSHQTSAPATTAPVTTENKPTVTPSPDAPPAPPKPRPKPQKPICKIVASKGQTLVQWNNRIVTYPNYDFTVTLNQLKELVDKKRCIYKPQNCSIMGQRGQSAISIDNEQAGPLSSDPRFTVRDLQVLKDSNRCKMIAPTYSVLTVDGQFAAYIDGDQATEFTTTESSAQKDLTLFTESLSQSDLSSIPDRKIPSDDSTEIRIQNLKCWKGKSSAEQDKNLKLCTKAAKYNQVCELSYFIHGESDFDVCLQGFEGKANKVVTCFKSNSKAQAKENLAHCKTQLTSGQVCETNPEIHGKEKNEVCILE